MRHIFVILLLSIIFSLEMLSSGWITQEGLILRGVNRTDGIWNIGLIQELKYHFPPEHPGFAGLQLKGYHFLFHILVAVVSIATFIPVMFLYFQVFPLIISFLWGFGVFKTVVFLTKNTRAAYISTIMSFFGGSLAFILHFIGQKQLSIDSGLGMAQPYGSSMQNPAYASSIVLVIWSLYCLLLYTSTKQKKWLVLVVIFSGLSIGFKAYAGMILMGSLLVTALTQVVFEKKFDLFLAFVAALIISVSVFYPFNADYGFLVYAPFLNIIRMIEGPLNFTTWDELFHIQRTIHNYFGMTKLFTLVFLIFTLGNLGTRLVGVFGFFPATRKLSITVKMYILSLIGIAFIIPFFFIQPAGGSFNITQMHWYFLFLFSIFTGPGLVYILKSIKNSVLRYIVVLIFIGFTFPTSLLVLLSNMSTGQVVISRGELEHMNVLSKYGTYDDTTLEIPNVSSFQQKDLEAWFWKESNVIIPALGLKRVFVSNEVVIFPYEERIARYEAYTLFDEAAEACSGIKKSFECDRLSDRFVLYVQTQNIKLLYVEKPTMMFDHSKLKLLAHNEKATIYEVLPL